ncbi:MAG: hypothetical protein AAFR13_09465, partial [Pseudomonadota bacterium]
MGNTFKRVTILLPYLWLLALFLLPFLIVLRISLSDPALAMPPYTPLLDLEAGLEGLWSLFGGLDFENYAERSGMATGRARA